MAIDYNKVGQNPHINYHMDDGQFDEICIKK